MVRLKRIFSLRNLTALFAVAFAMALIPTGQASAFSLKCTEHWDNNVAGPKSLKACISVVGHSVYGRGLIRPGSSTATDHVPMVIAIYAKTAEDTERYDTAGTSILLSNVEPGTYQVAFARQDDQIIVQSPTVEIR